MKKKSKKRLKVVGVVVLVAIVLMAIFYFSTRQAILSSSGNDLPPITESTTWNGYPVTLEYPYKGKLVSGDTNPEGGDYSICNENDGRTILQNTISDFSLSTFISSRCQNYIKAKIELPAGRLTGNCRISEFVGKSGDAQAICTVEGFDKRFNIQENTCTNVPDYAGEFCCPANVECSIVKTYPIDILLEEPTTIDVNMFVRTGLGLSKVELDLNFEPLTTEEVVESQSKEVTEEVVESQSKEVTTVECDENVDCVDTCGDKTPTCESAKCVCTQKTTFESSSQSSTQSSVVEEDKKATDYLYYLIPIVILILVAIIIINFVRKRK